MSVSRTCVSPAGLTVINVDDSKQLRRAVRTLKSKTEIRIAPGTYKLTETLQIPEGVSNIVIRGATGNRQDVLLKGFGMTDKRVAHGIWVSDVNHFLLADLTIQGVYYHDVILNAGSDNFTLCNVRLADAGQQILKSNRGNKNAVIQNSLFEFTTTARDTYTGAINVLSARNWIIRDNVFRNIRVRDGTGLAGPTILMWRGSKDTIVERNKFFNCQYGIAFGLVQGTPNDHTGGIIRNNFYHRKASESGDVAIYVADSPDTKVLNNTIILNGTYKNAIEYRFPDSKRVEIANNLTDAKISSRNHATGAVVSNILVAKPDWFLDIAGGDFHITSAAIEAIDRGKPNPGVTDDIDSEPRPKGTQIDIGADEYSSGN